MRAASMFLLLALFTFATAWTAAAAGTGYTWTGSSSTARNNSANWNPSTGIPGGSSSDTAGIPGSFSRYPVINTGAGTIPVVYVTKDSSGEITYSNVVLATTLTDDHTAFTITIGAPPGTKTVSLKPRFYLRKLFTFTDTVPVEDTGPLDITGAFFLGGDANGDNQVDGTDYAWMRYWWGKDLAEWTSAVAGTGLEYDINGDGILDANDYPDFGGYGVIGAADYLILKDGWYKQGDPE